MLSTRLIPTRLVDPSERGRIIIRDTKPPTPFSIPQTDRAPSVRWRGWRASPWADSPN